MTAPRLDAATLRAIAEHASGVRDTILWFVVHGPRSVKVFHRDPGIVDGATVLVVHTGSTGKQPPVGHAKLGPDEVRALDLLRLKHRGKEYRADAVFWSESAVEKFVIPYYASKHGPRAGTEVQAILDVFHHGKKPPKEGETETDGNGVFALVHVPTSEYIPAAPGGPAADEFLAMVEKRGADGQTEVEVVGLDELVDRE